MLSSEALLIQYILDQNEPCHYDRILFNKININLLISFIQLFLQVKILVEIHLDCFFILKGRAA